MYGVEVQIVPKTHIRRETVGTVGRVPLSTSGPILTLGMWVPAPKRHAGRAELTAPMDDPQILLENKFEKI